MDSGFSNQHFFTKLHSLGEYLLVALLFAALHGLWDFSTFTSPVNSIRGWPGDNLMFSWNLWWVATALWDLPGVSSFDCPMIFAPSGMSFLFHTHTWLYGCLYAILQLPWRVFGFPGVPPSPSVAYNLFCILSTALSGLAVYILVRLHGITWRPALLVGGLTVAFCNLRLFSLFGHLNLVGTEFLLASIVVHSRAVLFPSKRSGAWWILGGALSAIAWYNSITYGIFAVLFWMYCGFWKFTFGKRDPDSGNRFALLLSPIACFLLTFPQWIVLLRVLGSPDYVVQSYHERRISDVANFFLPSEYNLFWGGTMYRLRQVLHLSKGDGVPFVGWAALWTLGWAIWIWKPYRNKGSVLWSNRVVLFWTILGGLGVLLSVGEWITVAGVRLVPLPTRLLREIPVINNLRMPERYILFVMVPLALLVANVAAHFWKQKAMKLLAIFFLGWGALFVSDSLYRFDVKTNLTESPYRLPDPLLETLRSNPPSSDAGAVWNLPSSYAAKKPLWWQTQHGRPIVFGASARTSQSMIDARFNRYPFLRGILEEFNPGANHAAEAAGGDQSLRRQMASFIQDCRIEFVLVELDSFPDGDTFIENHIPGSSTLYRDATFAVVQIGHRDSVEILEATSPEE